MQERRTFLKRTGLVLLGLAGAASAAPGISRSVEPEQSQPAMIIDLNRCTGCHSCVIACKEQNLTPQGHFNTRIETVTQGSFPDSWQTYTPELCHQCEDAPCVKACNTKASYQLRSGIVVVDWAKCIGDGACIEACSYDARFLDAGNDHKADKCDFCVTRLAKSLKPACVEGCPSQARIFGDLAAPKGEFARYLGKISAAEPDAVATRRERLFFSPATKR